MTKSISAASCVALALLLHAASAAPPARAENITVLVASGLPGGTYRNVYARNFEREMRGFKFIYVESPGSGRNLDMLADGRADLAFAQADIFAERMAGDPHRYGELMLLGRLADECLFIAYRKDGPVTNLAQLAGEEGEDGEGRVNDPAGRPRKIAVGDPESGMAGTWSYLVTLDPSLKRAEVDETADTLAINQLAVGVFDAVGWITDPGNEGHKMLRAARGNDALAIMSITDRMLLAPLADGTRIYETRKIKLAGGIVKDDFQTLCTSAMVFTRKDANPRLIDKVSDLVSLRLKQIVTER
ncbi:MAG: hypothetical protein JRG92_17470 [Deltaproteobacteria bacterium]|nr:hypothetical protein [Deltaproteobacteria bacterium]MBW2385425.1 hypothetical protein [Deltaproteobacteria bacterium]MBW2696156.1 hypothetical protein [Deltaproteobacteria bacterium]